MKETTRVHKAPIYLSCLVFLTLLLWGYYANWIQYKFDGGKVNFFHFGETLSSMYTAVYYQVSGPIHWFIQQMPLTDATDFFEKPSVFYTHNINIGAFVIYLGAKLGGFTTVAFASILSALVYSIGIYFGYLSMLALSRSNKCAIWFTFFMSTDYLYNLSYGLNLIRAWHWLSLFSAIYATVQNRYKLLAFSCLISFLIGYDFSAIIIGVIICTKYLYKKNLREFSKFLFFVIGLFFVLFVLRQIQVIGGIGYEAWKNDFIFTFGLKIPSNLRWFIIPSDNEISAWYANNGIGRNTTTSVTLTQIISMLHPKVIASNLGTWNGLRIPFLIIIFTPIAFIFTNLLKSKSKNIDSTLANNPLILRPIVSLTAGIALGILPFFSHSWSCFFTQAFPLLSAPFYLILSLSVLSITRMGTYFGTKMQYMITATILILWFVQQTINFHKATPDIYPANKINILPYQFSFK